MMTNIQHFLPRDPRVDIPIPARRLRDFLGRVIMAGTANHEPLLLSALSCRKRIKRVPCQGVIEVNRQDLPDKAILWHCSECEDGGAITDWESTPYNLAQWVSAPASDDDPVLEITVSLQEHKAIVSGGIYDPDCDRMIYGARVTSKGVQIRGRESNFDGFIGYLAADANSESKPKRRRFLESVLESARRAICTRVRRHDNHPNDPK